MSGDRRNPYLILGVPYGTDRSDATQAFAARSRRAKRDPSFPYTTEDLTWALNQVESHLDHPTDAIDYFRVPADPAPLQAPTGSGLLRPTPTPLARRTPPATAAELANLRELARADATTALLERAATTAMTKHVSAAAPGLTAIRLGTTPKRLNARWPWLLSAALLAMAGGLVTVFLKSRHEAKSAPATSTTVVAVTSPLATTATPTTTTLALPSFGDAIEIGGLSLRPTLPLNAYGLLCVLFEITGQSPLVFLPEDTSVVVNGQTIVAPALTTGTGRAPLGNVYGDPSPQQREVCWPATGWEKSNLLVSYSFQGKNFEWTVHPGA